MKKVVLLTSNIQKELYDDEKLLIDPFHKHGFIVDVIPWDKKGVVWENYDLVIPRCTWDYHYRIDEFLNWLKLLENKKINIWNPIKIIRWNMNKKYLLDLKQKDISIVPTYILNKKTVNNIKNIIDENNWEEVIVKPAFGASAYKINKIKSEDIDPESLMIQNILKESDLLVQPFMEEIETAGELSFIFFDKKFSHGVQKIPKQNEYRSQREYGGSETVYTPDEQLIIQTKRILGKIESPLLYARVDGLNIGGKFHLMELELIEPQLFFEKHEKSAEKFVDAVITFLSTPGVI